MIEKLDDPLLALFAEWKTLDIDDEQRGKDSEFQIEQRWKRRAAIEEDMARHIPLTPAGAVALVRIVRDYCEIGTPPNNRLERMLDNLITGLEGMGGQEQIESDREAS